MDRKVIAIIGGASGVGLSLAKLLTKRGAKVSIADVSQPNLEKAAGAIKEFSANSEDVLIAQCDIRNLSQVEGWLKDTVDRFGKLDGAANMAGVVGNGHGGESLAEQDEDDWDFIIGVNLTGTMHCMKAELKYLQSGGSIVNAASIAGVRGMPGTAAYCASKHGVVGLTRATAKEVGSKGIRINAVAPGYIDTPMLGRAEEAAGVERVEAGIKTIPIARKADPEEVAKVVAFLLGDESSFVTGAIYSVDGGWNV